MGSLGYGYASTSLDIWFTVTSYKFTGKTGTTCHYVVSCPAGTSASCTYPLTFTPNPSSGPCAGPYWIQTYVNGYDPDLDVAFPCIPTQYGNAAQNPEPCS